MYGKLRNYYIKIQFSARVVDIIRNLTKAKYEEKSPSLRGIDL